MSVETATTFHEDAPQYSQYRALCSTAVVVLVLGFISLVSLLFPTLLFLPLVGVLLGVSAVLKIKSRPLELTGMPLAVVGIVLCGLLLVGGSTMHAAIYMTEVPEG